MRQRQRDKTRPQAGPLAVASWALFDWATQPFYTLVVTFLFAPYFVNGFVGDADWGAAIWAYATGGAELLAAIVAPVAWRRRRRRPPAQTLDRRFSQSCLCWGFAGCGSLIQAAPI